MSPIELHRIEESQHELHRLGTDEIYVASVESLYFTVPQLQYQHSFGDREDSRFFGTANLNRDLHAFGAADRHTRSISLEIRGNAEHVLINMQNLRALGQVSDDEIEQFKSRMQGVSLSHYPANESTEEESELWFLNIVVPEKTFSELLSVYRLRRLESMLLRANFELLIQSQPVSGHLYLPWINERQSSRHPQGTLSLFSWLEPESQLREWPFG
jgi:hypothetical protein